MLPGRQLTLNGRSARSSAAAGSSSCPVFLGVLGGLLFSRFQPSLYRSDALVQVVPQRVPESYVPSTVTARVEDRLRALAQQVLSRTSSRSGHHRLRPLPRRATEAPVRGRVRADDQQGDRGAGGSPAARRRPDIPVDAFRISFEYRGPARRPATSSSGWRPSSSTRTRRTAARRPTRPPVPRGAAGRRQGPARGVGQEAQGLPRAQLRAACRRRRRPTCRRSRTRS